MKRRRTAVVAGAVVAAVAGAVVFQGVTGDGDTGPGGTDAKQGPVRAEARTSALRSSTDGRGAELDRRDTEPFSMLGVTWTDPSARVRGTVEVRTREAESGRWSEWLRLDGDSGQGESGASRGGTEPAWVGPSDGVEVRVRSGAAVSGRLPAGLRLDMVDPGGGTVTAMEPAAFAVEETAGEAERTAEPTAGPTEPSAPGESAGTPEPGGTESTGAPSPTVEPSVSEEPSVSAEPSTGPAETASPTPGDSPSPSTSPSGTVSPSPSGSPSPTVSLPPAPPSTAPRPPITSRADWGADESISPEEPGYLPGGQIKAVVVHHTAESNDYTCDQAPALVRGIYAYHVKQLGWKDLGYNFLVDKCGTVYEGRKGGVDRPVLGAHAYGFNTETTGISVLGTYTEAAPSDAAMTSVARIAAWKLGQYGVDPNGTAVLTAGDAGTSYFGKSWKKGDRLSFPVIHGHRDGYNTQCPGDAFYGRLDTVRAWAGGPVAGLALKAPTGAGVSGGTYHTRSRLTVNWSATTPAALVSSYEVLVDGKAAARTTAAATSAQVALAPGRHTVAVRAVHQSGRTATSSPATVVADATAPAFTAKPSLALRTGSVSTTAVPLTLGWKASDAGALKDVRLTAPVVRTYGPGTTSAAHSARPGAATTWKLTAADAAGNTSAASVSGTPVILQETSATRSGSWSTRSSTSYLGGKSFSSSSKDAALSWTFTGRSAAWVVSRAATSGQAHIYVDGRKEATVDLKSAATAYRQAIWAKTWASGGTHTVEVVVAGTRGRPAVTTDGLVYLQ